jgi:hypothetical protein
MKKSYFGATALYEGPLYPAGALPQIEIGIISFGKDFNFAKYVV